MVKILVLLNRACTVLSGRGLSNASVLSAWMHLRRGDTSTWMCVGRTTQEQLSRSRERRVYHSTYLTFQVVS